jgi:hypothetical protein
LAQKAHTPFAERCEILSDFWTEHKGTDEFAEFIQYNDIGLPLAYAVCAEIVTVNNKTGLFIDDTWDLLMRQLGIEDTGFENIGDLYDAMDTAGSA